MEDMEAMMFDIEAQEEIGGVASGWMPGDTAPKDGTEVLLFGGEMGDTMSFGSAPLTYVVVGHWNGHFWNCGNCGGHDEYYALDGPTHWQPLPAPPIPQTRGKEA